MQTRAACSAEFSDQYIFGTPYEYLERGRFLRRAFFDLCLPLGIGVENVKGCEYPDIYRDLDVYIYIKLQ